MVPGTHQAFDKDHSLFPSPLSSVPPLSLAGESHPTSPTSSQWPPLSIFIEIFSLHLTYFCAKF